MASRREEERQTLVEKNRGRKQKMTIGIIALSNLCAWTCVSLITPFFPVEAAKKGTSETITGFILSCSELIIFLMSPVFGKLLTGHNQRFFYIAGLCVYGICDVMFGFLNYSPSGVPFIVLCFAVRIVEAIGTASIMTASYAIAGDIFPERIGTVYGILEAVAGLGFLIGPALGGALYQAGGFGLPFWLLGSCVFVCGFASCVVLPAQDCVSESTRPSSLALLRSPRAWFGCLSCVVCFIDITIWGPVFAQRVQQFGITQSVTGLLFAISGGIYTLMTPLWGWLLDKNLSALPVMTTGLCCTAVVMLFFGPAPFFTFLTPALWLTVLTLVLMGFTFSPVVIGSTRCIFQGAAELGFKNDIGTFGLVGGLVQSSCSVGTFLGPILGGTLTENFGFAWSMVVSGGISMLPVIIFTPFLVQAAKKKCKGSHCTRKSGYAILKGDDTNNTFSLTSSQC